MDDAAREMGSAGGDDGGALEIWPVHVIEEALGDEADGIPRAIRSAELRVRLPRHHIDMLEYRADQQQTTVGGVLARELDGIANIASAHFEEVSAALPGFAEAIGVAGCGVAEWLGCGVAWSRGAR